MGKQDVPDLLLEQYVLGELSENGKRHLLETLGEEELRRRVEELSSSSAEILRQYPPEWYAGKITARIPGEGKPAEPESAPASRTFRFKSMAPIAAAALFAVAIGITALFVFDFGQSQTGIRIKGLQPFLLIYRQNNGEPERLMDQAVVRKGDRLQLAYEPSLASHGIIFSIDGSGAITLHFPENERASTRLEEDGPVPLGFSYELDDAPGFERFFFVSSSLELNVTSVLRSAKALAQNLSQARNGYLDLPKVFKQSSILLIKEE